jgi:hypothetical protein
MTHGSSSPFRILIILALLATPAGLRAQPTAPAEAGTCPVPDEPSWTAQEKFVWARICAGETANFNSGRTYGGNIDPRTTPLPDNRILRNAFIETILTDDKYLKAIKHHGVRVSGARFTEPIDLQNVTLANELWFESCLFEKGADLALLRASQTVRVNRSKVAGELNLYAARVASELQIIDSRIARLELSAAHIDHALDLDKTQVTEWLRMPGVDVGWSLTMNGGEYANVGLVGAHVAHSLNFNASRVTGQLQMDSVQVGVYLHLQNATLDSVDLLGARVQNQLSFVGAKVTGQLDMFDAQIGTDLWMQDGEFFGPVSLRSTQVGGQLNWTKAIFHKDVDLSGAHVGGEFRLSGARWPDKATLTARYARIGVLPRLSDAWPDKLHVFGLIYDGIAETGDDFRPWFKRQDKYARQPYEQLATVLQARGDIEAATAVRVAERDRDRSRQPWYIYAWLTLLKYLIGYGYYPYFSLAWVAGFVLIGVGVLWISGEGRRNHMPYGVSYSFDMLLPVIRLRDAHYQIDLQGWPRYYFYCHKLMGWVLASFLVAGLSGLTK